MLSCKQVATAISSGELDGAGVRRRLAAWVHLLICRPCRAYARQIRGLGVAARALVRREAPDPASLERLERRLVERCRDAAGSRGSDG